LVITQTFYRSLFAKIGSGSVFYSFGMLAGPENIVVGRKTLIRYGCRLETIDHGQTWIPRIEIGDNVNIEQNVHMVCHDRITIGNRVSITGHCAIVDVIHPVDADHIGSAIDPSRSFVEIGDGSFIGFGATIMPNVRIGRGCVVGAGAVVTIDIPDFGIVAGVPARLVGSTRSMSATQGAT